MKKELSYFRIGKCFGGNQDWFRDPMMRLGGCAAATACDLCVYLALYQNKKHLCPYEAGTLDKKQYIGFSKIMKPYLKPRREGVNRLELYIDGFGQYLKDREENSVALSGFDGAAPLKEAAAVIKGQIDRGMPVPYLLLKHKDPFLKDFVWHWFLLVGYEDFEDTFMVKTVTYGEYQWMDFKNLWNTGYPEKGGLIIVEARPWDSARQIAWREFGAEYYKK